MKMVSLFRSATRAALAGCCIVVAAACDKETPAGEAGSDDGIVPVTFTASNAPSIGAQTRAAVDGEVFTTGTYPFAFWICNHEETPAAFTPHMSHYGNLQATLNVTAQTETQNYEIWSYGPNRVSTLGVRESSSVDIYAYYPYVDDVTDPTQVPFTSGQEDWMWAEPAYLTTTQTAAGVEEPIIVPLRFQHAMTCIEMRIKTLYTGSVTLTSLTLTDKTDLSRLCSEGTFSAVDGTVTRTETGNTLTITPRSSIGTTFSKFYLIFPEVANYSDGEFELSFVFNNIAAQTVFPLPAKMTGSDGGEVTIDGFETGTKYIYELTLDNTMHFEAIGTETNWVSEPVEIDLDL